jgi:hypothetical protein
MHRIRDSFIYHRPYAILAIASLVKYNTSLFLEHIHSTSTPTLRTYSLDRAKWVKWYQRWLKREAHTPLPIQGYWRRSPKQSKRSVKLSPSPSSSDDEGEPVKITRARPSGRRPDYVTYVFVYLGSIGCNYLVICRFDGICGCLAYDALCRD